MRLFRKKMPDAELVRRFTLEGSPDSGVDDRVLIHTFTADGRRWTTYRGKLLLLRDDGSVVGDDLNTTWELLA